MEDSMSSSEYSWNTSVLPRLIDLCRLVERNLNKQDVIRKVNSYLQMKVGASISPALIDFHEQVLRDKEFTGEAKPYPPQGGFYPSVQPMQPSGFPHHHTGRYGHHESHTPQLSMV